MEITKDLRLAVLIDADNVPYANVKPMFQEIAKYGTPTFKRIYADWTKPTVSGWKKVLLENAITPIQQYSYSTGKNASDSAMIIDAMDILHTSVVDGFCLVSSDSDYTRLATRIRETGIFVMGIGEKKTPKPFVNACDVFVYTENLAAEKKAVQQKNTTNTKAKKAKGESEELDPMPILTQAFEMAVQQDGWASLANMGNALYQVDPSFDPRTYGHKQLSKMISKLSDRFEMRSQENGGPIIFYVRMKD